VESGVEKTDKAASPMRRRQHGRRRDLEQQPHDTSATTGPARPPSRRRAGPCGRCRLVAQRPAEAASANCRSGSRRRWCARRPGCLQSDTSLIGRSVEMTSGPCKLIGSAPPGRGAVRTDRRPHRSNVGRPGHARRGGDLPPAPSVRWAPRQIVACGRCSYAWSMQRWAWRHT